MEELPFHAKRWQVFIMYIIYCMGLVMCLHAIHDWWGGDPFAIPMFHGPLVSIDSWSIIHVICFIGVGFLFPESLITMFAYGLLWEALEITLASTETLKKFWSEPPINTIWDLWFNMVGYRLGERIVFKVVMRNRRKKAEEEKRRLEKAK